MIVSLGDASLSFNGGSVAYKFAGEAETLATLPGSVQVGEWVHVALAFDDATDQFNYYFNGVESTTFTQSGERPV